MDPMLGNFEVWLGEWAMVNGDLVNGQWWMVKVRLFCFFLNRMLTRPAHFQLSIIQLSIIQFSVKNMASPFSVPSIWMVDCFFSWPAVNHLVVITIADYLSSTLSVIRFQLSVNQLSVNHIIQHHPIPLPFFWLQLKIHFSIDYPFNFRVQLF